MADEFTTSDSLKQAEQLTDSGLQVNDSVTSSTVSEQPTSEGPVVTPVTPESGRFLPHECDKEALYLANQEKKKQVVSNVSNPLPLLFQHPCSPMDVDLHSTGNQESLPTSKTPESLQGKDVQGYLETQASQEKVVVGPKQTVLRTPETNDNVDKCLYLPLTPASLQQGHPSIGNRSVEEVVEENERLKHELDEMRRTRNNQSRVFPLANQSEDEDMKGSSGSDDKPLSCSLVQEATTSIQRQTQLETELQQMKEDHQKLLEECAQMKTILKDSTASYEASLKEKDEQLAYISRQNSLLQESNDSKDEQSAALVVDRDRLECECRALTETVRKLEKVKNECDEALTEVASWKKQFNAEKAKAKEYKHGFSQTVAEKLDLEQRFDRTKRELEAARRDFEEKRVEAKENERKWSASVARELGLKEEFDHYKRQYPSRQR